MRRKGLSLTQAAERVGTTRATVKRYAATALERRGAAYRARGVDRAYREVAMLTEGGNQAVAVQSSRDASLIARHQNAVRAYVQTGDDRELRAFEGRSITDADGQSRPFLTDNSQLRRLGNAGVLSFESIYASAA